MVKKTSKAKAIKRAIWVLFICGFNGEVKEIMEVLRVCDFSFLRFGH
jgi:hypothetical protein